MSLLVAFISQIEAWISWLETGKKKREEERGSLLEMEKKEEMEGNIYIVSIKWEMISMSHLSEAI